jgi:hypothetical protein
LPGWGWDSSTLALSTATTARKTTAYSSLGMWRTSLMSYVHNGLGRIDLTGLSAFPVIISPMHLLLTSDIRQPPCQQTTNYDTLCHSVPTTRICMALGQATWMQVPATSSRCQRCPCQPEPPVKPSHTAVHHASAATGRTKYAYINCTTLANTTKQNCCCHQSSLCCMCYDQVCRLSNLALEAMSVMCDHLLVYWPRAH